MPRHAIEFRDYQIECRDAGLGAFQGEVDSALCVLPTGTGKTIVAGMFAEEFREHGHRTLFIAHREVLIEQAYQTMGLFGLDTAVEMGQQDALAYASKVSTPDVVVGSIQTLQSDRLMRHDPSSFGLIVIDECHRALADSYTKTLNWFQDYKLLGITATPTRGDRRNLGARFQKKVYEYKLASAISDGWLKPIRIRTCPLSIDLRGISTIGGDFNLQDLSERIGPKVEMMARALMAEIGDKPGVAFVTDVGAALFLAQTLEALGVKARYVAGVGGDFGQSKAERKKNLADFEAGEYQAVICCELLVEGWDSKRVEWVGIMRPTLQQYRYTQMVGRGTRKYDAADKRLCLVLDFDWETDDGAKDLCTSVSLFDDGSVDMEVFAEARRLAEERAVDIDPIKLLEEAEDNVRFRKRFAIKLTGAAAKYEAYEHDPIGVSKILDFKLNRKYDLDKRGDNPASQAQIYKLQQLGITAPASLSKWGASKMIDKIVKRKDKGMADFRDVQKLISKGMDAALARAVSGTEAQEVITKLQQISTHQGELF